MPPLLPPGALGAPPRHRRWALIAAAALVAIAYAARADLWDGARSLVPTATERHEWDGADLDAAPAVADPTGLTGGIDPAGARSARLTAGDLVVDLLWDPALDIAAVRVETYEDAYGTGHRLAVAADATTAPATHCLNAALGTGGARTSLQTCARTDRHPPLHPEPDTWAPDKLFVTQTANLDPADAAAQVDYFGLGLHLGDSATTGVWGPNYWSPMTGDQFHDCDDRDRYVLLDDLHLRPEYADPAEHRGAADTVATGPLRAEPVPGALLVPACVPVGEDSGMGPSTSRAFAAEPFRQSSPAALSGWTRYNAAQTEPGPLRTVAAFDVRSCDTTPGRCTGDHRIAPRTGNDGPAQDLLTGLLDA